MIFLNYVLYFSCSYNFQFLFPVLYVIFISKNRVSFGIGDGLFTCRFDESQADYDRATAAAV